MVTFIVFVLILAAVVYALERNHRRQTFPTRARGGVPFDDRDLERIQSDLAYR